MINTTILDIISNSAVGAIKLGINRSQVKDVLGVPDKSYHMGRPNSDFDKADVWEYDDMLEVWFDDKSQVHNIALLFKNLVVMSSNRIQLEGYIPSKSTTFREVQSFLSDQNIKFETVDKGVGFKIGSKVLISFYDSFDEDVPNFIHKISIRDW